jgi:small subunit ribosomal protein S4
MARYLGSKSKVARRFKEPIFGPSKSLEKRSYPPGQHGLNKRRGKQTEYGVQLSEKQKVKYIYGILERQFAKTFVTASRMPGITGENLLKLVESRLDNVVYRMGIAPTRNAARQLVSHRHIAVNNKVVNIPSYILKSGDIVSVRERSKALEIISDAVKSRSVRYPWLEFDTEMMAGKFLSAPAREQITENIKEQLIVELYSK